MKNSITHIVWPAYLSTKIIVSLVALLIIFLLSSCIAAYDYNVIGTWDFLMLSSDNNPYDEGIITFSDNPMSGSYIILNYDQDELTGTFSVLDDEIRLTGSENWKGNFLDENTIQGEWWHGDGTRGTFEAVRQ